ncbi:hypothetical protein EPJ69_02575 [Brachyspira aalborgi]|uniref:Uncharacterized protein n=1 Tax=Brachyspira aalborgi TaxID=29522 RepID=A0A5C8E7V7_9SPIR|nr:hypothetical protein [Brachyspira aalborgi]TXJ34207.1 hypothetical protein EPJ69_02575 [Brachyspira aalborgi]
MEQIEKEKLKEKLLKGEIDIDELYYKYQIPEPFIESYEKFLERNPNLTIEQYNQDVLSDKITILFWQMGWEKF